jgi:hypothetical protein
MTDTTTPIVKLQPIAEFNNSGLREAVEKALSGVPEGHGRAILDIENKGAGIMVVQRFENLGKVEWGVAVRARYYLDEKSTKVQAALQISWP